MAGQEGLEPTTCGFGDRRSTNWSYWPKPLLLLNLGFLVLQMLAARGTKLAQRQLFRLLLPVFSRRIIAAFALGALQRN